jgi:hypothetical protein
MNVQGFIGKEQRVDPVATPLAVPKLDSGVGVESRALSGGLGFRAIRMIRPAVLLALLIGFFLFVPMLQGVDLSAGQGASAQDPGSALSGTADALAAEQVRDLVERD